MCSDIIFAMIQFPKNFLWGAATSAYQVEGNNFNSDWWPWEKAIGKQPSGDACRHYNLYPQDFDLAQSLNHNAHRLSIEWARIEPREGEFLQTEIQHYIDVILALRARGIEPMVTLHHFTNPIWFSQSGAWENKRSVERFFRYCDVVTKALAPYVHYWITINEPSIYASHSYIFGAWPPQIKSYWKTKAVYDHMTWAHIQVYHRMHQIYQEMKLSKPAISIAQHLQAVVPCTDSLRNRWAVKLRKKWFHFGILDTIARHKALDFIGVNYYSRQMVDLTGWGPGNFVHEVCQNNHTPCRKNSLGWDIYPQGLYLVLKDLQKYNVPIFITENGICTLEDNERWEFIKEHLKSIHKAISEGVDVQGYLYWSLLDNFEWAEGFVPRFGLIAMNYDTQERTVRESARKYAVVCKTGILQ
ncbi:MAG: glycoside hydrolase family 1 protein [Candidatus Omnitrophica bacterium]|nr:glycoside hydrolase family 1 protein [Candidatus Omnitrophota bacterium]